MIISAVAIRKARKLANGYRSPIPPHSKEKAGIFIPAFFFGVFL